MPGGGHLGRLDSAASGRRHAAAPTAAAHAAGAIHSPQVQASYACTAVPSCNAEQTRCRSFLETACRGCDMLCRASGMGVNPADEASDVTVMFADAAARVSGLEIWSVVRLQRQSWSDPERLDPLGFAKWNLKAAGRPRLCGPVELACSSSIHAPACCACITSMTPDVDSSDILC